MDKRDKQQAEQMQLFRQQQTEQMQLFRQHLETRDTQHEEQMDSLCQQLHSEQKKNENDSQELVRVHQQVANLTKEIKKVTQGLDDEIEFESYNHNDSIDEFLANYGREEVEEYKEGEQTEDEPCAAASTSKVIRRTEGSASRDHEESAANAITTQKTSKVTRMSDYFSVNKRSHSPTTTTNNKSAIVPSKKTKSTTSKSGPT